MFRKTWSILFLLATLFLGNPLEAQTDRYELGRRVKRFEVAWQSATKTARDRSTLPMQRAVSYFFGLDFKKAAKALDVAFFKVKSDQPASDLSKWIVSRNVTVQKRVADAATHELKISIGEFYETKIPSPAKAKVNVTIYGDKGQVLMAHTEPLADRKPTTSQDAGTTVTCRWKPGQVGAGDFRVSVRLLVGDSTHQIDEFVHSRISDLEKNLAALNERIKTVKESSTSCGYQTLKLWRDLIVDSHQQERLEIDYPVHRLMKNFNALCGLQGNLPKFFKASKQREFWIALRAERKRVSMRIRLPKDLRKPRPLLFVFHGAGGSDNMFFETYGAGRSVDLAVERGWIVVSPNQGLLSRLSLDCLQMTKLLNDHLPVDEQQIMLLGHSMGAAQVITQVKANPKLAIAAVAMGGGRGQRNAKTLSSPPWFVAAGEKTSAVAELSRYTKASSRRRPKPLTKSIPTWNTW